MADDVRIGMIGSGFMGLTYSESIFSHVQHAQLTAVAGGRRAESLANDYSVTYCDSIEAMLSRDDVDAVVLATPDQHRLQITEQAAAAGKHVLVEKPMAPTIEECDGMISACDKAGVNLGVVKTERFRKITNKAKALIDDGTLGQIAMMRTVSAFPINVTKELFEDRTWMYDKNSGGLFMGMASHNTDFLCWLTGKKVVQVFAQATTFSDIAAPNQSVMAQLVFEDGIMGHMWITSELPPPSIPSSEVRFQVVGSKAMFDLENFEFLDVSNGESWERAYEPERFDYLKEPKSPIRLHPHIQVIQTFVDSIVEQRPPTVGGQEGRAAVEICQACLLSAQTGQAVNLPL